jgi:uncharacterized membrane protein
MSVVRRAVRGTLIASGALGYVLLAHYTNITPGMETIGMMVAVAPIVLACWSLVWRSARRRWQLPVFVLACVALVFAWNRIEHGYSQVYWMEHAGTQLFLCLMFGRTLQAGREPMCTTFADMVHGPLTPALKLYTRQVTVAWVVFFGAMATVSTALFFFSPLKTWSIFANFFTGPLIGLMFVVEYGVRRRLHRDMKHAHFLDAIKVFWKAPAN